MSLKSLTSKHTMTHKRRTVTRGSFGGQVPTITTVNSNLKGRIQELSAKAVADALKADGFQISHAVYFSSNPGVLIKDFFEHNGSVLEVVAPRNFDRLNRLWRVDCMETTDKDPRS